MCFCSKCGAKPGEPCRTSGGNRTTFHKARETGDTTPDLRRRATRLACWREGWKSGACGFPADKAQEMAHMYLAPEDWLEGWTKGRSAAQMADERARRKYMGE